MTESKNDIRLSQAKKWIDSCILKDCQTYHIAPISSDASFRRYFRITASSLDRPLILMDSPPEKEPIQKFLSRAAIFSELKITIPTIYAQNLPNGFLIIEDFGDTTLLKEIAKSKKPVELLFSTIDILLQIESEYQKKKKVCNGTVESFSEEVMLEELNLFRDWYVGTHLNQSYKSFSNKDFKNFCYLLTSSMLREPKILIHRDFHSKNLMYIQELKKIGVIDFQDAVIGPLTYDLVSLLKDAYVNYDEDTEHACLSYFYRKMTERGILKKDFESFKKSYDYTAIQRNIKIIGIFCRLKYRDKKENYMTFITKLIHRTHSISKKYTELSFITNFFRGILNNPLN